MNRPESHLSGEQVNELRTGIVAEIERLEKSMLQTEEALRPIALDQSAVGRLSRIDALQNQGLTRNLSERQQARWGQLAGALRRLENGSYGICTECEGPISYERLLVFPETPVCVRCST